MSAPGKAPGNAVIVGAGIVGLSCAWFLQEQGVDVTVVDRRGVAAGASWGNAGYVSPSLVAPLPEPSVLRYGVRAFVDPRSPVRIPLTGSRETWRFLLHFARNATAQRWRSGVRSLAPLNAHAQEAFDELVANGVAARLQSAPILAVFRQASQARGLLHEVAELIACGQPVDLQPLDGNEARREEPLLSEDIEFALRITGQRSLDPAAFVAALARSVEDRGGAVCSGVTVRSVESRGQSRVAVRSANTELHADAVVLAAGAWLPQLARPHGVRLPMHAGRGYSFTVRSDPVPRRPVYFPAARAACTPTQDGLRIVGLMDLERADARPRVARVRLIEKAVAHGFSGVQWSTRRAEWVGARPLTADGLPLIGPTRTPGVFLAGGHGMWGLTLGPVTGRLLARAIVSGVLAEALAPFDPCR